MKKIIALLVTLTMVFSLALPSFAAKEDKEYDGYPVIIARGISFTGLVDLETGKPAIEFRSEDVAPLIFEFILGQFAMKNKNALRDTLVKFLMDYMGPIAGNPDGTSKNNVGVIPYNSKVADFPGLSTSRGTSGEGGLLMSVCEAVGENNTYYFRYDWRKSPEELACEFNDLVEIAKQQSGKEKVKIAAASMGAMVSTAYIYYYGHDSVDSITYLSSAANGTYVCGDAYNGKLCFTPESVVALLEDYITGDYSILLKILLKVADITGAIDLLCDVLNSFINKNKEYVYDNCLRDLFGTAVGMWALCPDEDFKSGMEFLFEGHENEYPILIEKLKETEHFLESTEETTLRAYNDGVKIAVISGYNNPSVPVFPRANLNGDGVVETELSSFFATVAPYGKTLSDEYIKSRDEKYISPDKVIDASTCLFPDSTWFIKNAGHVSCNYGSDTSKLFIELLLSETQPNVTSVVGYQQFLVCDENQNFIY